MRTVTLDSSVLALKHSVDERLVSYNIEMTEVTGGTFWKAYTPGQIAGTDESKVTGELTDFTSIADLMRIFVWAYASKTKKPYA